jgi:hypothetical protein
MNMPPGIFQKCAVPMSMIINCTYVSDKLLGGDSACLGLGLIGLLEILHLVQDVVIATPEPAQRLLG